jgi:hypothetical protein
VYRACVSAGRLFILLTASLLIVMPWTEYFWSFDRFLRGGQDFELGLLSVMIFLCLIIVLLQHCKADVLSLLTRRQWLHRFFRSAESSSLRVVLSFQSKSFAVPLPVSELDRYNLPIQV